MYKSQSDILLSNRVSTEVSSFILLSLAGVAGIENDIRSDIVPVKLAIAPLPPCNEFQMYLRYLLVWNNHFTIGSFERYIPQKAPTVIGVEQSPVVK